MSTFEEILEKDGKLVYKTKGVSMNPMLYQNRDLVVIEVPKGRLKKYDVALYKRGNSYVLHRVIGVNEDGTYSIRGDNTYSIETVPESAVIGVLTAFLDCMVELLSAGVAVKLDGLGTFYPTMESKGAESPVGYNVRDYLKGLHIRFQPEGATEDNITSRVLKKNVQFKQNMIFDRFGVPKKVVDGQLVDYGDDDDGDDDDNNQGGGTNDNGGGNG